MILPITFYEVEREEKQNYFYFLSIQNDSTKSLSYGETSKNMLPKIQGKSIIEVCQADS